MPAKARVAIELYVDDQGTLRVRQFAKDTQDEFRKTESAGTGAAGKIQTAWTGLQAAWAGILAALLAIKGAWDSMNTAAKARQEEQAFNSLAASYGTSGKIILAKLKEVSAGTIDTMTLVRNAGTAMMMGIAPDDVVKLLEVAKATAKMTGQTTVKAFEDISLAVGRQSKMILDNLGIILDVEKANADYAKSIGKTASQLTDAERKQAFMNATLKAGGELMDKLGNQQNTLSDKFERFKATIENVRAGIGDGLIRVFYFLEGTFNSVAAAALAVSGGIFKIIEGAASLTDRLHITSNAAAEWKINSEAAFGAAGELAMKADQSFKDMQSSNDAIIKGQAEFQKRIKETTQAMEEQEKTRKKIVETHKKEAEAQAQAEKEMYQEAGIGAQAYYQQEATALVEKAARWQKAGGDQLAIEEWLYDQLGKLSQKAWEEGEELAGIAVDNLQVQSSTLVEELLNATEAGLNQLQELGIEITNLDGSNIGITATLDGSGITSEVDAIIAKLRELQQMKASAAADPATPAKPYENTDPNKSAAQVAAEQTQSTSSTTININQQLSRSDVTAVINEQQRRSTRS